MDDALKIEKEGGQMNMCKALEELEEKGEIKSKISLIQKKSQRGDSVEKIADDLMEDIQFIQPIYEIIKQNPTTTIGEIYQIINK